MSLVNDMLRDLEERWPNASEHLGHPQNKPDPTNEADSQIGNLSSSFVHNRRLPRQSTGKTGLLIASAIIVFLLVIVASRWLKQDGENASMADDMLAQEGQKIALITIPLESNDHYVEDKQITEKQTEENQIPENALQSSAAESALERPVTAVQQHKITPEIQRQIDELLKAGSAALLINRLTTPDYDNAYDRFRAVLSLNPDDEQGLAGLQKVRQRYLQMLDKALNQQRHQSVPGLIRKALLVGVSQKDIDAQVAAHSRPAQPQSAIEPTFSRATASSGGVASEAAVAPTPAIPASVTAASENEVPMLSQSFKTRDEKMVEQARNLKASGFGERALQQLEFFVNENPNSVAAYQELFSSYIQADRLQLAHKLLDKGAHLSPANQAYLSAQLLVAEKNYPAAVGKLLLHSPPLKSWQSYYALQAALYHKLGDLKQSELGYRQLVSAVPNNPAYWLGLSVALDDSRQVDALSAYQKVLQLSSGVEPYIPYVRERIAALTGKS